jgi:cysteine desulfurase
MSRVYLDHAATTPLRPEAREAMLRGFDLWANPSSPHAEGRKARAALEDARARVRAALGWQGEVIFTSGASEALAIGLRRAKAERRIVSAVEHDAVFRAAPDATVIGMDEDCFIDRDALADALKNGGRPIVALQQMNSETGTIQDVSEVASQVREAGGVLLSDCSQSAGKMQLPDADLIVISAHKFGGPIGIGALLVRDYAMLEPCGGQERGYRSGTENLPAVLGMEAALSAVRYGDYGTATWIAPLVGPMGDLQEIVSDAGGRQVTQAGWSEMLITSFAMPGVSSQAQLIRFDAAGFAVSAGSACSSGSLKPSRVLAAFGVEPNLAATAIRVSFGWTTTAEEIDKFGQAWLAMARAGAEPAV